MNKMTKGALATGLGVALLIGGGGTLAVWNAEATAHAGSITSGNMTLDAGAGTWRNAEQTKIDITKYKVVPGDTLTLTQPVKVALEGNLMKANLTVDKVVGTVKDSVKTSFLTIETAELLKDGKPVIAPLTPKMNGNYTATVTVALPTSTDNLDGAALTTELSEINFQLQQQAIDNK